MLFTLELNAGRLNSPAPFHTEPLVIVTYADPLCPTPSPSSRLIPTVLIVRCNNLFANNVPG